MRLEGKAVVDGNLLTQVEVVPGEELPILLLARLADNNLVVYYNAALSANLRAELAACLPSCQFPDSYLFVTALLQHDIRAEVGVYKTYIFSNHFTEAISDVGRFSKDDPRIQAFGFGIFAEHVFAVERDGRIASACVSVRENDQCGEAWVYTDPVCRQQGLAQRTVRAWAKSLIEAGKTPFYSHELDNVLSARLASRLGLLPIFDQVNISYANI